MTELFQRQPDVVDGDLLSAYWLNTLSDNIEYLHGLATGYAIPFPRSGGASGIVAKSWWQRHRLQYLNVQVTWDKGTDPGADFTLTVKWGGSGGTTVISQSLGGTLPTTAIFGVDINAAAALGGWYEVWIDAPTNSYAGTYLYIDQIYEAATDDTT